MEFLSSRLFCCVTVLGDLLFCIYGGISNLLEECCHLKFVNRFMAHVFYFALITVEDKSMLRYIRDKTAAPYFSNLVWFIGSHIIELDSCVRNDAE